MKKKLTPRFKVGDSVRFKPELFKLKKWNFFKEHHWEWENSVFYITGFDVSETTGKTWKGAGAYIKSYAIDDECVRIENVEPFQVWPLSLLEHVKGYE